MGEFSYICKQCDLPIVCGQRCALFLLVDGRVVEYMVGENSNYGTVLKGNQSVHTILVEPKCPSDELDISDSERDYHTWLYDIWGDLVTLHFEEEYTNERGEVFWAFENGNGFAGLHEKCWDGVTFPTTTSIQDPNQGWYDPEDEELDEDDYQPFDYAGWIRGYRERTRELREKYPDIVAKHRKWLEDYLKSQPSKF